jgi:hypothetical protein
MFYAVGWRVYIELPTGHQRAGGYPRNKRAAKFQTFSLWQP